MVSVASSAAVFIIVQMLFISAWLSTSSRPWLYYGWAALAVLLWAQPWSRSDPYRTNKQFIRLATYGALVLSAIVSWYVYDELPALLIGLEAVVLGAVEARGQAAVKTTGSS